MRRRSLVAGMVVALAAAGGTVAFVAGHEAAPPGPESETLSLRVDLSDRRIEAVADGEVTASYDVTIGSPAHPTPTGRYRVDWIVWNPSWTPPNSPWARGKKPIGPGPGNPMGRVKLFFRQPAYYVHGTTAEEDIGRAASHGCVRMRNSDVIELAQLVMEHGGEARPPNWFMQVINRFRDTREVTLSRPVPIEIVE